MENFRTFRILTFLTLLSLLIVCSGSKTFRALASSPPSNQASDIPSSDLIQPVELAKMLQGNREKPLIIQVGSRVLFEEAHIPGSEYVGPASSAAGREKLRQRLQSLARNKTIILYCGCCPWSHCPNIKPAWDVAHSLGLTNLRILYIADNFGADWVDKGFPTAKGQ